jgi:flavin-dependent dehydrogenase
MTPDYDVAIIGGGPAGSTAASMLLKYWPRYKVVVLEREKFPRDHVGESQLPLIGQVLNEIGVWDKIEQCNFPIKIGATYRWGRTNDLWDFEFLENGNFQTEARPSRYAGQRAQTAFQVDRAVYDQVLLNHSKELGAEVREQTAVRQVLKNGDAVTGLQLSDGSTVTARYYIDASGHSGIIRRAMGVEVACPTSLQNIAIWDYFTNAEWAVSIGVGGTRVQVMSLGYGWLWFIPLGPERTSVGLIVPATYYKESGKRPQELFDEAVRAEPIISQLLKNATSENLLSTTKDWSFVADRLVGENWFLAGESAGFADPILAAGMTLAHMGARDVAYTILALDRKDYEADWLKSRYDQGHRHQIAQHIRFADFWYTQNGVFTDLKDHTRDIAKDLGLELSSDQAWRWFGQGGFIDQGEFGTGYGGYSMVAVKRVASDFLGDDPHFEMEGKSHFRLNLEGAEKVWGAVLQQGKITRHRSYKRNGKVLPNSGMFAWLISTLKETKTFDDLGQESAHYMLANGKPPSEAPMFRRQFFDHLEAMISDGWVDAWVEDGYACVPKLDFDTQTFMHQNRDVSRSLVEA